MSEQVTALPEATQQSTPEAPSAARRRRQLFDKLRTVALGVGFPLVLDLSVAPRRRRDRHAARSEPARSRGDDVRLLLRRRLRRRLQRARSSPTVWKSMKRVYGGFFLAALIGIPLGLMIGRIKLLRQLLDPTINLLRPIPVTAWLPLSMIFFGLGPNAAIFLVFLGAFYPILLNTIFGVRSVDPRLFEAAAMLGCAGSRHVPPGRVAGGAALDLQRAAHRARLRLDPDRGRRDDRRAHRPRLGDHGRPHAVAHRPGGHRHDRDRRRAASSPTASSSCINNRVLRWSPQHHA